MGQVVKRVLFGLAIFYACSDATAQWQSDEVSAALDAQDAWLSSSSKGAVWQQYLLTDALREQLAKGGEADKRELARIVGRYSSGLAGLQRPRFSRTRRALSAWADNLGVPLALRWAGQIRGASPYDGGVADRDLDSARDALKQDTIKLDNFLRSGSQEHAVGWKEFLHWDDLLEQLQSDAPDWSVMDEVVAQFFSGELGLEYPRFGDVRNSLRRYVYLGKLASSDEITAQNALVKQIESLAVALEKYNDEPSTKAAANVAYLSRLLKDLGQASELTAAIRSYHQMPNIRIKVAENFLARRFGQPVSESRPVDEMILKTHVRGTAHTTGNITADVIANPHQAQIDILFRGVTNTSSIGRQSPVTIYSHSATSLQARKPLFLQSRKLLSEPTRASATTNTKISRIVPDNRLGRRLVERVAWTRAGEQKSASEAIASGRAARRFERQMDAQSEEMLGRLRGTLRGQLQGPLNHRGLFPEQIQTSSTHDTVIVTATQAADGQFAANSYPPSFSASNAFSIQVHESAINNTIEKAIGGLLLRDEKVAEIVQSMTGSVPEELQISDDQDPWSIQFDFHQPVTLQFDNQIVTFTINGRQFTSGDRKLNSVEISAQYQIEVAASGAILRRAGDIEVEFRQRLSNPQQIFFRSLLRKKFSGLFKEVIEGEGFSLPGRWQAIGTLRLNEFSTDEGWLSLGWK